MKNNLIKRQLCQLMCIAIVLLPAAHAKTNFDFQGFGTLGLAKVDDTSIADINSIFDTYQSTNWDVDYDSRFGIQGSYFVNDKLSFTTQFVALGTNNYQPQVEWAYASYQFNTELNMRLGILRRPFYANSDILHVGYAYNWVRPPLDVYSIDLRYFDDIKGIALDYSYQLSSWDVLAEVYFGKGSGDITSASQQKVNYNISDSYGAILTFEKKWMSFRASYHTSPKVSIAEVNEFTPLLSLLKSVGLDDVVQNINIIPFDIDVHTISAELNPAKWLFKAEVLYIPDVINTIPQEKSWYLTAGKRLGAYTIHATYSKRLRENKEDFTASIRQRSAFLRATPSMDNLVAAAELDAIGEAVNAIQEQYFGSNQHSYTFGVRYDFETAVSIKAEYQRIFDNENKLQNNLMSVVVDFLF